MCRVCFREICVVTWYISGLVICTIVSCFFSSANVALRDFSRRKLEEILTKKNKFARFEYIQQNHPNLILTTSVIRTAVNLILFLILVQIFATNGLNWAVLFQASLLSLIFISIFSVAIPQAWAKYSGEKFLSYASPVLQVAEVISFPILMLMQWVDFLVKRLSGVNGDEDEEKAGQEELLEAVQEGEEEGVVDPQERKMIESVIELRDITVGQIMTPRTEIDAIDASKSLNEIKEIITEHGHSRMPVYRDNLDDIIGMLYVKDLLQYVGQSSEEFDLESTMRQCYFVPETKPLRDIFREFRNKKLHVAIVLDEYGGTLGLITFEDVLEQIVGQITDEYEPPETPLIKQIDSKTMEIEARMRVDELNDEYKLHIPESEDYETMSGFLFSSLGQIPTTGETFQYRNLLFTIIDASERKINSVRLEILPTDVSDGEQNQ